MSEILDTPSLSEAFIQFQIQVQMKEIEDFEEEICQLEDKKKKLIKLQEQLREEHRGHVRELQKQMKEQERNLEQRQREDEEQVERMARENLELKHKQEKELEVKELQAEQQVWLQYKNKGSIKDQQKIQKLEKDIASTKDLLGDIRCVFSIVLLNSEHKYSLCLNIKLYYTLYSCELTATDTTLMMAIKYLSLITHNAYSFPELVDRPPYPLQPLAEAEGAQQRSDATTSGSTTTSTPPDFSKIFSSQTDFTGPTHLGLLEQMLLCMIGKAYPLHTLPNDPADMGEEMTFDLLQTERWPVTTEVINRKFQQSVSQSGESDASVNDTCEIQQLLAKN
uniref:Uncharacterized protein n=1 Tax=Sinocyclocheilus rhinocerous TaxID=307959 RepID=A0A673M9R8_9TELE